HVARRADALLERAIVVHERVGRPQRGRRIDRVLGVVDVVVAIGGVRRRLQLGRLGARRPLDTLGGGRPGVAGEEPGRGGDGERGQDFAPGPVRWHRCLLLAATSAWPVSRRLARSRAGRPAHPRAIFDVVKLAPSVTWTILFPLATLLAATAQSPADSGWPAYGNDPGGARYSGLAQIDRSNVTQLRVAWTFRTGALQPESPLNRKAAFEATPILVDGKLLLSTPFNNVTARGVSAWRDTKAPPGQACRLRIFAATLDARLTALDGDTGRPCADFGAQ